MTLAPDPTVRVVAPTPSLAHRLWFGWTIFWAWFFTATMSPLLVLHSAFRPTARTIRAWMLPWSRFILGATGIRVEVEHRAAVPDGPVVFVSNHTNSLDIMSTMVALGRPFLYMARHEVRSWPFVGWVLEKTACLFIRRDNPRQAVKDLRRAAERIQGGDSVLLFAEGGRSHRHGLQPFMRGPFVLAIEAGVPVIPVTLIGNAGVLSKHTASARPGRTRVVIGEPLETSRLGRADSVALMKQTRAVIEAELSAYGAVEDVPAVG
ncbi:lysophospholipid acyltransferase family protein [Rubrivirga sp.]|uniref:lysophospholipid acyltransferase family protein n=1 Tax=Rubrivirga sp. TaxID=1885344 RepID=UPI003C792E9E